VLSVCSFKYFFYRISYYTTDITTGFSSLLYLFILRPNEKWLKDAYTHGVRTWPWCCYCLLCCLYQRTWRSDFSHLRQLRPVTDTTAARALIQAFITCRLGYRQPHLEGASCPENATAWLQSTGFCCPCSDEEMLNRLVSSRLWSHLPSSRLAMPFILYWWQYVWLWKILAVSFVRPPTGGREPLHELTTLSATEALLSLVVESRTVCQLLTYTRRRQQFLDWKCFRFNVGGAGAQFCSLESWKSLFTIMR